MLKVVQLLSQGVLWPSIKFSQSAYSRLAIFRIRHLKHKKANVKATNVFLMESMFLNNLVLNSTNNTKK